MVRVVLVPRKKKGSSKRAPKALPLQKAILKDRIEAISDKINNLKKKTQECPRNRTKKYRYTQIRAALKRKYAGKPANLKPLTAGQKSRLGPLERYNVKYG